MPRDLTDYQSTLIQVIYCIIKQQATTWANAYPDPCHIASLGHSDFNWNEGFNPDELNPLNALSIHYISFDNFL